MNREDHIKTDLLLLGYSHEGVHAVMDEAVKWLGAGHRSVRHSADQIRYFETLYGEEAARIALLHLLVDNRIVDRDYLEEKVNEVEYGE